MDTNFSEILEEIEKIAIYGIVAGADKDGTALKFVRALFENGCPPDAFMEAIMAVNNNSDENNEEETE